MPGSLVAPQPQRVLLTGATGYVGGRLLPLLEQGGFRVRCLVRRPEVLTSRVAASTEVIAGDVLDRATLDPALRGIDVAYYLVHSMGADRVVRGGRPQGGTEFRRGGTSRRGGPHHLSRRLGDRRRRSSRRTCAAGRRWARSSAESGVPVIEFRASIVIGSGSLSFEMIRSLVERLPVMITPKWVNVPAQPIAIDDLLAYLIEALRLPESACRIYEIGGADRMSYAEIMRVYARLRGLPGADDARARADALPVEPLARPGHAALRPNRAQAHRQHRAFHRGPGRYRRFGCFRVRPMGVRGCRPARARAGGSGDCGHALVRCAVCRRGAALLGRRRVWSAPGRFAHGQRHGLRPRPRSRPIQAIGGETGWYAWDWLWHVRGFLDLLVGGVGMRRGRPSPTTLRVGDTVDFWRVEAVEPNRLLRLAAEMKLPGRAWLEFEVTRKDGESVIRQTASFDPVGPLGRAYWYALYPVHQLVFGGMLRAIARAALVKA